MPYAALAQPAGAVRRTWLRWHEQVAASRPVPPRVAVPRRTAALAVSVVVVLHTPSAEASLRAFHGRLQRARQRVDGEIELLVALLHATPDAARRLSARVFSDASAERVLALGDAVSDVGAARNEAARQSRGEFVLFLDVNEHFRSDDALAMLLRTADDASADVVTAQVGAVRTGVRR